MSRTRVAALSTLLLVLSPAVGLADIWINEFHYDNTGDDSNEFIEIAVSPSLVGFNPALVSISRYNGNNSSEYTTPAAPSLVFGSTDSNGYSFYSLTYPADGVQNGAPDGFSLSYNGSLIQFLSYEGVFTGSGGPANGVTSTNVGVTETSSTPLQSSLHLVGNGTEYSDFTWAVSTAANTKGFGNTGQTLAAVPEASSFIFGGLIAGVLGLRYVGRRVLRKPAA